MIQTRRYGRIRSLLLLATLGCSALSLLTGCHREEVPVSPNEKTAAPARLPGEDPHAHSAPVPSGVKK